MSGISVLAGLRIRALASVIGVAAIFAVIGGPVHSAECEFVVTAEESSSATPGASLPVRAGPRTQTSGRVPHVQLGVTPVAEVVNDLSEFAFSLPGVVARPTIVSLPGATGMWLGKDVSVAQPQAIVSGREFAHIHTDGSLHAPLPFERAMELVEKGWGERHPWAEQRAGWEGFVMLYTPMSNDELGVIAQLIVDSYNHVTGGSVRIAGCR